MRKMSVRKWRCISTVWDESVSTSAHDSPGQIGASLIMKMTKRIDRIWFTVMIVMNLPHVCRNIRWIISRMLAAPLPPLQMQVDDWRAQNWTVREIFAQEVCTAQRFILVNMLMRLCASHFAAIFTANARPSAISIERSRKFQLKSKQTESIIVIIIIDAIWLGLFNCPLRKCAAQPICRMLVLCENVRIVNNNNRSADSARFQESGRSSDCFRYWESIAFRMHFQWLIGPHSWT